MASASTVWAGKLAQTTTITNRKGNNMNDDDNIVGYHNGEPVYDCDFEPTDCDFEPTDEKEGNKMNILIKIISWFFVIAGLMLIIISASTTDDVDLIYVGALAIVGLATFAFGIILVHRDD